MNTAEKTPNHPGDGIMPRLPDETKATTRWPNVGTEGAEPTLLPPNFLKLLRLLPALNQTPEGREVFLLLTGVSIPLEISVSHDFGGRPTTPNPILNESMYSSLGNQPILSGHMHQVVETLNLAQQPQAKAEQIEEE